MMRSQLIELRLLVVVVVGVFVVVVDVVVVALLVVTDHIIFSGQKCSSEAPKG